MTNHPAEAPPESRFAVLRRALRNRDLCRVLAAFLVFNVAEWASYIALLVWAFELGGVRGASLIGLVQLIPSALLAPVAASVLGRLSLSAALLTGYAVQGAAMATCAAALLVDAAYPVVAVSAAFVAVSLTFTRPVHNAALPPLSASTPELTAGNAVSGSVEAIGVFVGPLLCSLLIVPLGPGGVLLVLAVLTALACVLCLFLSRMPRPRAVQLGAPDLSAVQVVARAPAARLLLLLVAAESVLVGLIDILLVVLALDVLGMARSGPGVLNAAVGVGALAGAGMAVLLVGRPRLAPAILAGAVVAGVGLAASGLVDVLAVALVLLAASGAGRMLFDVGLRSLVQRALPDHQLTAVFGINEAVMMTGFAAGTALASGLVSLLGVQGAFLAAGVLLPAVTAVVVPAMRRLDAEAVVPQETLRRLTEVPFLSVLSGRVLERLALGARSVTVAEGGAVTEEGEHGEDFFVIVSGRAAVTIAGEPVRELGAGDFFGELALLREVPRTATVRATTDLQLEALHRVPFLTAVLGTADAVRRVEDTVTRYR